MDFRRKTLLARHRCHRQKRKEIFEGDILADRDQELFEVVFVDGKFMANPYSYHGWLPLDEIADTLEINGHIAEEDDQ